MHEGQFVTQIVKQAQKYGRVRSITIEVGDLAPVRLEDLQTALKAMTGWQVKAVPKQARVRCGCGYEGSPQIVERQHALTLFICPRCGLRPRVWTGKEIRLVEVEIEGEREV